MNKRIFIAGGGVSGLATAWYLEQKGFTNITLAESLPSTGGKLNTVKTEGYLVELGPDSFLAKPDVLELIKQLELEGELIKPVNSHFSIYTNGKMVDVPAGLASFVPDDIWAFLKSPLLSLKGKLRLMLEPFIPAKKDDVDESLEEFIVRRLGRETLDKLAAPLFSGVYATPAHELSVKASFPQFVMMEKNSGSISKAVLAQRKKMKGPAGSPFRSFKTGMHILPSTIRKKLRHTTIIENSQLNSISFNGEWKLLSTSGEHTADVLILAAPANRVAGLFSSLSPDIEKLLHKIPFNSTRVVTFAFDEAALPGLPESTGFLIPSENQQQITACTFLSHKWEGRAPEGKKLIRCFVKLDADNPGNDAEVVEQVLTELKSYITIKGKPEHQWQRTYFHAQPSYRVGHSDLVSEIEKAASKFPGLYFTGTSYRGIGIPDCVKQAKDLAAKVANV